MLNIDRLTASVDGKEILKGIDLMVEPGQIHVLMGPNGSGKSTLAQVIAGHPSYKVESGKLKFESFDLVKLTPDKRAKLGIFMGFQHPAEIPGVSVFNVLRKAKKVSSIKGQVSRKKKIYSPLAAGDLSGARVLRQELLGHLDFLKLSQDFLSRALNEGFSGGEKKRSEILQMMALSPKLVILDEIDSGLDVDGLKIVAAAIKKFSTLNSQISIIIITHYARILKYLKPDFVHIMMDGEIIKSGKGNLASEVEKSGYEKFKSVGQKSKGKNQNFNSKIKIT